MSLRGVILLISPGIPGTDAQTEKFMVSNHERADLDHRIVEVTKFDVE